MSIVVTILGTPVLWPTQGDTNYSNGTTQFVQLVESAVFPIAGLYNNTTGKVGAIQLSNSDTLTYTVNGGSPIPIGGVSSVGLTSTTLTVSGSPITTSGTITADLPNTGVTPASYTYANITVDAQGRITAASSGTPPVTTPAGSNTEIQFNNSGSFGASSNLTWNGTALGVNGNISVTGTGRYFNADFSDVANRLYFRTSSTNNLTMITTVPNGTSNISGLEARNSENTSTYETVRFRYQNNIYGTGINGGRINTLSSTGGSNSSITMGPSFTISSIYLPADRADVVLGGPAALPTTSTNGFLRIWGMAGTPTGVPETIAGTTAGRQVPVTFDTTNNLLYYYTNGAWRTPGTVTSVATGTGLTGGPITSSGTISLADTAVTAGSYTNANITVDAQGRITAASNGTAGTVTSVDVSGGTTGLTTSGGPITSSGTITLGGTLGIANGGTGQTTANDALNALLPSQGSNAGKVLSTDGTNTSWVAASVGSVTSVTVDGTSGRITSTGSPITSSGTVTLDLATTAVTPGSYTLTNLTVDSYGRITAASNGTAPTTPPAGANTEIQYNNSGAFGASSQFTWDNTNSILTIGSSTVAPTIKAANGPSTGTSTLTLLSGTSTGGTGAGLLIASGTSVLADTAQRATINMGTAGSSGQGSSVTVAPGRGVGAVGSPGSGAFGGALNLNGSLSVHNNTAQRGGLTVAAADGSAAGNGSATSLFSGSGVATNGNGGNLTLTAGVQTGSGTPGVFIVRTGGTDKLRIAGSGEWAIWDGATTTPGVSGQVLTSGGAGSYPTWTTPTTGTVTSVTVDGTSGRITSSGSPITGSGTITLDLATTAVTPGSYTYSNITVDSYGRITAASNGTAPVTSVSGTAGRITSSGGTTPTLDLATTAVTPASYTNANITVDAYGRITSASNGTAGTVTSVDVSGGTTGLTTSGGPVTGSGTITLGGTLGITNGGTGQTTANAAFNALVPSQTGNSGRILTTDGSNTSWTPQVTWLSPIVQTVTYSSTPTINWSSKDVSRITLTGNATITNSGAVDGQKLLLEVTQGGSGGYTIAFTSETRFGTDITSITLSTAVGKMDRIGFVYNAPAGKYDVVAFVKGF